MRKYLVVFTKSIKSEMIYRSAMLSGMASSVLSFLIQVFLWQALLGAGGKNGTSFSDMVLYVVISAFVMSLTKARLSDMIESTILDGSVSMEIIRPISYKYYLLMSVTGKNFYKTLTGALPAVVISLFLLSPKVLPSPLLLLGFLVSVTLGVLIAFEINYIVGLLAFWIQRCWFLGWYMRGFMVIFGGTTVPLWFYPETLQWVSFFLPFRYMTFEPINIFLGKTPPELMWQPILVALLWLCGLSLLDKLMWKLAVRKLSVNGG